jgi:hypothetical protein
VGEGLRSLALLLAGGLAALRAHLLLGRLLLLRGGLI